MEEIPDLEGILRPFLAENVKIANYSTKSLIAPGENYGSIMLAVDVTLSNNEELHLVAKKCPTSEFIKQTFNTVVTFKKEVLLYKTIVPSMQNFQKRHGCVPLESFAKYYGSRYSLDPKKFEVDEGCCLLLENIKVLGFDIEDRMKGFNLDCTKFIVKDLATFHAVPVAMKLKEPERFRDEIHQHIATPNHTRESFPEEMTDRMSEELLERLSELEKYKPHIGAIRAMMTESAPNFFDPESNIVEPYASIVHSDYWTNNTMIKLDNSGRIVGNRFVDFQMIIYGNPLSDLMFFLFTSVEIAVLRDNYDEFIDLYYKTFIQVLKDLKVEDIGQFSRELYQKEIDRCMCRSEMYHALFMLSPIFTKREKATALEELNEDNFNDISKLHLQKYYEKMLFVLDQFVEKGWLKL